MGIFNFSFRLGKSRQVVQCEIIAPDVIHRVNIEGILGLHKKDPNGNFLHPFEKIGDETVYRLEGDIRVIAWEDNDMKSHIRIAVDGGKPIPDTVLEIIRREQKDNERPPLHER